MSEENSYCVYQCYDFKGHYHLESVYGIFQISGASSPSQSYFICAYVLTYGSRMALALAGYS